MDQYLVHVNPGDTLAGRERWPVSLAATSAASGAEYGIVGLNEGIISPKGPLARSRPSAA
jgi:hypothetical protein